MLLASQKTHPTSDRHVWKPITHAVAVTMFIAAVMFIVPSCEHKPVLPHAHITHLPHDGWQRTLPLTFRPEYDDSAMTYDVSLVVRHDNRYRYRNLSLVVDILAADSALNRQTVNLELADEYGNWTGGGFGALYQDKIMIARTVDPADVQSVVVWQAMPDCDTLQGLVNIGIIVAPFTL